MERDSILVTYLNSLSLTDPGYSGIGVFGYYLKDSDKSKNIGYPIGANLIYTEKGILLKEDKEYLYETTDLFEMIIANPDELANTFHNDLLGVYEVLEIAKNRSNIKKVVILSNNKQVIKFLTSIVNIVKSFDEGKYQKELEPYKGVLIRINTLIEELKQLGVKVGKEFIKDENDIGIRNSYMYSLIGATSAKNQHLVNNGNINKFVYAKETSMTNFKKELMTDHITYEYKDMIFESETTLKREVTLLASAKNENEIGKRNLESVYALTWNDTPNHLIELREDFSRIKRLYNVTAKINMDKLKKDRVLFRLMNIIGHDNFINAIKIGNSNAYAMFDNDGLLIEEMTSSFPFIMETHAVYERMQDCLETINALIKEDMVLDITDKIVQEGKFILSNQDKYFDFTNDIVIDRARLFNKALLFIGKDIPSYAVLKMLSERIDNVYLYVDARDDENVATVFCIVKYKNERDELSYLIQTNLLGKLVIYRELSTF